MAESVRRSHHCIEVVTGEVQLALSRVTDVDGATFFDFCTQELKNSAEASISWTQAKAIHAWLGEQLALQVS